jgi:hypothetical protein
MKKENNNLRKTIILTVILCLIIIVFVSYIQLHGQSKITSRCSYLDPITIDLLAFVAALFLFFEGLVKIFKHPNATVRSQLTRIFRVTFGCAIMTLHIIQFFYK